MHGFGDYSDSVVVRADDKPGAPSQVLTTANGLNVDLVWSAPTSNNGSAISEYRLSI